MYVVERVTGPNATRVGALIVTRASLGDTPVVSRHHAARAWIGALLVAASAVAAACGSSSSGDGSSPPGDGGPGASNVEGGGGSDGGSHATNDGGGNGIDGGTTNPGDGGPFCASLSPKPTFCADFDQGAAQAGFDGVGQAPAGAGAIALDTKASLSPPASLAASLTAGIADTSMGRVEVLNKAFVLMPATSVRLAYGVRVAAVDPTAGAQLSEIEIGKAAIVLYVTPTKAFAQERVPTDAGGATYQSYPLSAVPAMNAWTSIEVLVDLSARHYRIKIGGALAIDRPLASTVVSGKVGISMGLAYYSGSTVVASAADFDNVTLDIQ